MGRPRLPRTVSQRAEARRAQVRLNVQAFRQRQKRKQQDLQHASSCGIPVETLPIRSSQTSGLGSALRSTYVHAKLELSEVNCNDIDDETWSEQLPYRLNVGPAFKDALIGALQYRCLPDHILPFAVQYDPNVRLAIGCSNWVSSARITADSPGIEIVTDALLASALSLISRERDDNDMALYALHVHTKALHRLRRAFARFTAGKAEVEPTLLAMAVLTCGVSELLTNQSWDRFAAHLQGVGALIVLAGPAALNSASSRAHFYGYRPMQAAFCFIRREATFLADRKWIDLPGKKGCPHASLPLHTLLDFALQIPVEMERFDRASQGNPHYLRVQLHRLRKIASRLDRWEVDLKRSCNGRIYCKRPAIWPGFYLESFQFDEIAVATAFTFYTGVRVQLFNLVRAASNQLALHDSVAKTISDSADLESLAWSRRACQCFEFFYAGKKKVVGKLTGLFPFDAAWETFVRAEKEGQDVARELDWCKATALRVTEMGLPVLRWRSKGPESADVKLWLE